MLENGIFCDCIDIQGENFTGFASENIYKIFIVLMGFIAGVRWGLNIRNIYDYEFVALCMESIRYCRNKWKEIGMTESQCLDFFLFCHFCLAFDL